MRHLTRGALASAVVASVLFDIGVAQAQGLEPAPPGPTPEADDAKPPEPDANAEAPNPDPATPPAGQDAAPAPPTPETPPVTAQPTVPATASVETDTSETELSAADADLTSAELAELGLDSGAESSVTDPKSVDIYGFIDFQFIHFLMDDDNPWFPFYDESSSFAVGNLNVYLDATLARGWRTLAEIRFTYLPFGDTDLDGGDVVLNTDLSTDYADFQRGIKPGGIEIERAWLDYSAHSLFNIRLGQWLTPYGIWNVDHGSPTIIPVRRPYVVGEQLFPERQTGIQIHGSREVGDNSTVGYHATVSNGRGPIDQYRDLDSNKGVGGRLWFNNTAFGDLTVGTSAYYGRFTNKNFTFDTSSPEFRVTPNVISQFDELAVAADVKLEVGDFQTQVEAIVNQRRYAESVRPVSSGGFLIPDFADYGGYFMAAYRTPWFNIMPFGVVEYYNDLTSSASTGVYRGQNLVLTGGINIRPIPAVALKAAYTHVLFPDGEPGTLFDVKLNFIETQVAWAF